MRAKSTAIITTVLAAVIFASCLYRVYAPVETSIAVHYERIPGELVVFLGGREIYLTDRDLIKRFDSLARGKTGIKINPGEMAGMGEELLRFDYGYKEKGMLVTEKGRIIFTVDKAEIRNSSRAGYLWWKINGLTDKKRSLYYVTEPDPDVAAAARAILAKTRETAPPGFLTPPGEEIKTPVRVDSSEKN